MSVLVGLISHLSSFISNCLYSSAQWSVSEETDSRLSWDSRPVLQLQLVRGLAGGSEDTVWVVVRNWSPDLRQGGLVLAVSGHYNHGLEAQSSWLTQFLSQQPKHVTTAAWTVQHKYFLL